jgi:uroporphyrinogen decarboxylase
MSTPREEVIKTIRFQGPSRLVYDFPDKYGSDFVETGLSPSPDARPSKGIDEWGAVWDNMGNTKLGEVKEVPLKDWSDFDNLKIPDITLPERWDSIKSIRDKAGDKFLLGHGISIYERLHFIRGLENTWVDIYENRDNMCRLLDILVEMNLYTIEKYKEVGVDGFIFCDDWGLQDRLMISPSIWCEIWKPRYETIYRAAHEAGMCSFLHSCGYIVDILDDLIEIGLDVIHMDQQENMGLELLSERFGGRITFFSPVDIQSTMVYGTLDDIREYCRKMVKLLGTPKGGFIPRWYSDPKSAGHREEAVDAMCQEFIKISHEMYGQ